ncbi:CPCC family cysteine-rich protein [Acanthopleuribacter pedis]|uniref:CPCC family cysteine-rich protein n=1 Tax=Acanthopleuribacter pedis TaxID=442870 RepID=UPI00243553FC|nr:CPCC family cysteine-rich protein [Acanthopleuribacter pedis]
MEKTKKTCPCCGCLTLEKDSMFDVCPVCFWEDDPLQSENELYKGGANQVNLKIARINYLKIGAISEEFKTLTRKPLESEIP